MNTYRVSCPAKINLFLHITGKRADGYHNLQTVFRLIDLCDTLTATVLPAQRKPKQASAALDVLDFVNLSCDTPITDDICNNLIIKAAAALLARACQTLSPSQIAALPSINLHLTKRIPMGAGLGGGSSDCASVLLLLNQIWQLGLQNDELQAIGATLGADVPIFIVGQDAMAEGIGEQLTPIDLPPQRFLLLMPDAHINTARLFAHHDLRRDCPVLPLAEIRLRQSDYLNSLNAPFGNVFEPVVSQLSKPVQHALDYLNTLGQITHTTARLTGSGGSVFLPLSAAITADAEQTWQQQAPCRAAIVQTLPVSGKKTDIFLPKNLAF